MANHQVNVSVLAETKQFRRSMAKLGEVSGLKKLSSALANIGEKLKIAAKYSAAAAVALGGIAVAAASKLEQSTGTIDDIFKQNAAQVHAWAASAAKDVGLSKNSYNELAAVISTQLKNGGTSMDELGAKSNNLIKLGADLSAGFGGSTADAVSAISSALKGERDPIERYGVSLKQATIDAKAAELGFKKVGGSISNEANQAATLALIMEQTGDMHGKFGREADTLAHKQEVFKAQLENVAATLGTYLLPALTAVVGWASERLSPALAAIQAWIDSTGRPTMEQISQWINTTLIPGLQQVVAWLQANVLPAAQAVGQWITGTLVPALTNVAKWVNENRTAIAGIAVAILAAVATYKAYVTVMATVKAAKEAAKLAQIALNAAMAANPIGLVIAAFAALAAGIVYLWNTNEGFRRAVTAAWNAVNSAAQSLGQAFGRMKDAVVDKISGVVTTVRQLPSKITSALGNMGNLLLNAGRSVIQGFINGITGMFGKVKEKLSALTSWLPDWKGPAKRDATILRKSGQLVIGGFIDGMESSYGKVRRSLGGLTGDLPGMVAKDGTLTMQLDATAVAIQPPAAPVYHIHLATLQPTAEAGRIIVRAIEDYEAATGRRAVFA
ncbi:MAG: hypothetical protein MSQ68_01035 [Trueperella pyogenes]|nr:hypothetical protein [Trueperella pyogenes]MCI7688947.1 hypothetical protein [Trueperella pyogenes]